jgi:hypothetical protein
LQACKLIIIFESNIRLQKHSAKSSHKHFNNNYTRLCYFTCFCRWLFYLAKWRFRFVNCYDLLASCPGFCGLSVLSGALLGAFAVVQCDWILLEVAFTGRTSLCLVDHCPYIFFCFTTILYMYVCIVYFTFFISLMKNITENIFYNVMWSHQIALLE